MEEWSALCRCCLAPGSETLLFGDNAARKKFYEITSIEVKEEDGLPQRLCGNCVTTMNSAHQFRRQCLRIDTELKLQLAGMANFTQPEDFDEEMVITEVPVEQMTSGQAEKERRRMTGISNEELLQTGKHLKDSEVDVKPPMVNKNPKTLTGLENDAGLPIEQDNEEIDGNMIMPEVLIKSEQAESDDDCYYVLVIDDSKENNSEEIKEEPKELNPATGEMEFEKSVDSFLLTQPIEKRVEEESQSINMIFDKNTQQYHFTDENDSEDNSQIELGQADSINGSLLASGENGNIIKILTTNGTTENLLFKGEKGDEIVTYIMDNQFVSGESDILSQEEVIVCEGDDSQFQIVNYDGSELVIEYTDDGQISSTVVRQDDGTLICSCGVQFSDLMELENHQIIHHSSSEGGHLCGLCGKGFESNEMLTGHMLLHNNVSPNIQCPYCEQLVKRHTITQHIKYNHNTKPRCGTCEKTFANPNNLKRHMMIHSGIRMFECEFCQQRFHQKITMQTHRMTHLSEPLYCHLCDISFEDHKELYEHKKKHSETASAPTVKRKSLSYPCNMCRKVFTVESVLQMHMEKVHSSCPMELLCSECGEVLPSRKAMWAHTFVHRSSRTKVGKRYDCKTCGKSCASQAMLIMHERVHTNERPFPCPLCALRFKTKTHLRTHQLTHTREKKFGCSVCLKFFALKGNLVVHLRTHTGERPYTCSLCAESFIDSKYLKKHKLRKHSIGNVPWNHYY